MSPNDNLHTAHRQRIKKRYLDNGLSSFSDHEVLELLLTYALPRQDTNAIGHRLMQRFGSLSGVFEATVDELCKVDGIAIHSAILIHMIHELCGAYLFDREKAVVLFDNVQTIGEYLVSRFIGATHEMVFGLFLDNGMHLISCKLLSEGDINSSHFSMRTLAQTALSANASHVIIAHNHPHGSIIPSDDDLNATNCCRSALDTVGVSLIDHYIVSGNQFFATVSQKAGKVDWNSVFNAPEKSDRELELLNELSAALH